jgi:hypothetical protein
LAADIKDALKPYAYLTSIAWQRRARISGDGLLMASGNHGFVDGQNLDIVYRFADGHCSD